MLTGSDTGDLTENGFKLDFLDWLRANITQACNKTTLKLSPLARLGQHFLINYSTMNSTIDCRQYLEPNPEIVGIGVVSLYPLI
jgi:hypothetical protein